MNLIDKGNRVKFGAKRLIIQEGQKGASIFVVLSGTVQIYKGRAEHEVILAELGPGEMFGSFGVLGDGSRTASARAVDDIELIEINYDQIQESLQQFPKWLSILVKDLVFRINEINEKYVEAKNDLEKLQRRKS